VMTLPVRQVTCAGCGHVFDVPPGVASGLGRITRCTHCPPGEPAPALEEQLWELAQAVKDCERRERLQDRLDLLR
jgi:hypothetical protein